MHVALFQQIRKTLTKKHVVYIYKHEINVRIRAEVRKYLLKYQSLHRHEKKKDGAGVEE